MFCILYGSARCFVALLAEGVDRNGENTTVSANISASPSSRRAWIEIDQSWPQMEQSAVALLAEGVDRNHNSRKTETGSLESPSSRRAWIEIILAR